MTSLHRWLAACAASLALGAALVDGRSPAATSDVPAGALAHGAYISALDLAERIASGDGTLRPIDLRSADAYAEFHVPTAVHITPDALSAFTVPDHTTIVLYADDNAAALQAWMLLRLRGHDDVFVVRGGLYEWIARVHEPVLATDATPDERAEFERAAALSRFFGGLPRAGVSRAEVPAGYWTGAGAGGDASARTAGAVAAIRRRGC